MFDLFVIGGGSGGVRAARVASKELGLKVGLAEGSRYGGTCVIRGCVPKKLMVFASEFSQMTKQAQAFGWQIPSDTFSSSKFSWATFKCKLDEELSRLEGVYRNLLKNSGVTTYDSFAKLIGPNTVELDDGTQFTAKYILLATGGRPTLPKIPGAELIMTSDDVFNMKEIPKRIAIVGSGYIACEFASILSGLGSCVTLFCRTDKILRGFDVEASSLLRDCLLQSGVQIEFNKNVVEVKKVSGGVSVIDTDGLSHDFNCILFAIGRVPNTQNLNLHSATVQTTLQGAIEVDQYSKTSCDSVYAVGDVTNRANLTPVAIREAMAFVETVFKKNPTKVDYSLVPSAVFTQPELGSVGLSEEAARLKEPIEVYKSCFRPMKSAFADLDSKVLLKMVVSRETRVVLGCHIVAPSAGELIQMISVAIQMGATKEDIDRTIAVHPTTSEELVTIRNPS